jgi:hypothetical protein
MDNNNYQLLFLQKNKMSRRENTWRYYLSRWPTWAPAPSTFVSKYRFTILWKSP